MRDRNGGVSAHVGAALQRTLTALELADCSPRPAGAGWLALCPAHEDRNPSLSIRDGDNGRVLIHCFAGCDLDRIMTPLGLAPRDLFDDHGEKMKILTKGKCLSPLKPTFSARTVAVDPLPPEAQLASWELRLHDSPPPLALAWERKRWSSGALAALDVGWDGQRFTLPIRDGADELLNVCRYLPDGRPKLLATRGRPRDLFPAPERLRAALGGEHEIAARPVYVVEGEPDAISAAAVDLPAIAVPGANGWRADWARRFAGMHIRVLVDHDQPGARLATLVAVDLARHAASVRRLAWPEIIGREPAEGYDLGDWVAEQIGRRS